MPKSEQQAFNPLTAAKSAVSSATRQIMGLPVTDPVQNAAGQLQRSDKPKLKGVSALATHERLPRLSMRRASAISAILHVLGPIALAIVALLAIWILSLIMHFNFWDWFKPKTPQDMTFTLVEDTHVKRPENPLFKGNTNQQAGGRHHKEQPLNPAKEQAAHPPVKPSKPVTPVQKQEAPKPAPKPEKQSVEPQPVKAETPKPPQKQPVTQPDVKPTIAKPAKEPKPETPKPVIQKTPSASQPSQEPVQVSTRSADFGISVNTPQSASVGNPQEGKAKAAGVDVAQDVDYGPFMADLQKRISRNWIPPRGMESRKILVLFYIQRDGQVAKVEVKKSSGDQDADRSAIEAVRVSAPFMAFPPQIKEDLLPVEFTFDYNVLNPKNAKKAMKW